MAQAWGDSALLVPIPEAEPIVAELRLEHDAIAARGVPAHVTVLFPFVPRALIRPSVHRGRPVSGASSIPGERSPRMYRGWTASVRLRCPAERSPARTVCGIAT